MPTTDRRAAAFARARDDLRVLLAASNLKHIDLARHIGLDQSNLSRRLRSDRIEIFDIIAEKFPPASWVAARLYLALAEFHLARWETVAQEREDVLREKIAEVEALAEKIRKRDHA